MSFGTAFLGTSEVHKEFNKSLAHKIYVVIFGRPLYYFTCVLYSVHLSCHVAPLL